VAASEFAVCLPVLILLVLGTIESCTMIFLKQSLTVGAYEGIRTALEDGATVSDIESTCQAVFRDRRVQGGSVTVAPANFGVLGPGDYISVTVSAPTDPNSVIPGSFFRGRTFNSTATMMKEF
jgi:Flp pilus assembly protein TadG